MNSNRKPIKKFFIKIDEKGMKFSKDMKLSQVLNTLLVYCFSICKQAGLPYAAINDAFCSASAEFYPDDYFPTTDEIKQAEDEEMSAPTQNENYKQDIEAMKAQVKERMEDTQDEC